MLAKHPFHNLPSLSNRQIMLLRAACDFARQSFRISVNINN
ncbi:hypothetical protein HMPREF3226_02456 [Prevotella corporis]|uniref:Uncharacterized protein n=1 Tax=Prevotella corporis TaxID=28128 RepID=A0A133PVH7_9BACT|nr:hypothetical protein HMPREF3226_02456 [Prevotella corporis]